MRGGRALPSVFSLAQTGGAGQGQRQLACMLHTRPHLGRPVLSARPTCRAASIAVCHRSTPARAPLHPSPTASSSPPPPVEAIPRQDISDSRGILGSLKVGSTPKRRAGASAAIGDEAAALAMASWRRSRSSAAGSSGRAARLGGAVAMAWSDAARLSGQRARGCLGEYRNGMKNGWHHASYAFA